MFIEVPADDEDDLDPESEDNPNDEIETPHTVCSNFFFLQIKFNLS